MCALDHRDPFELIVAVALSAQTTDVSVNKVTPELFRRYPDAEALAAADPDEVMEIIRTIGLYRNKSKNIVKLAQKLSSGCRSQNCQCGARRGFRCAEDRCRYTRLQSGQPHRNHRCSRCRCNRGYADEQDTGGQVDKVSSSSHIPRQEMLQSEKSSLQRMPHK